MAANLASDGSATALTEETFALGDDRDRLRRAIANQCLQHPRRQVPKTDRTGARKPNACRELGRTGLAPQSEARYQLYDGVLRAGHEIPLAARRRCRPDSTAPPTIHDASVGRPCRGSGDAGLRTKQDAADDLTRFEPRMHPGHGRQRQYLADPRRQ